jgi:hypothetical protein
LIFLAQVGEIVPIDGRLSKTKITKNAKNLKTFLVSRVFRLPLPPQTDYENVEKTDPETQ